MDGVTFRPARVDEIDRLSDITNDPPTPGAVRIAGSARRAIEGGRVLARRGLSLRLEHCTVAEADGEVVGVMDAGAERSDAEISPALVLRLLVPVVRTIGLGGLWRLLRSRPAWGRVGFAAVPGAYHVFELDVDARYRGRGIGAEFLRIAERQARARGCVFMSLTTDITNPAQHLYERAGFRIAATKRDAGYEQWNGSPGRVLMVKGLA